MHAERNGGVDAERAARTRRNLAQCLFDSIDLGQQGGDAVAIGFTL